MLPNFQGLTSDEEQPYAGKLLLLASFLSTKIRTCPALYRQDQRRVLINACIPSGEMATQMAKAPPSSSTCGIRSLLLSRHV